MEYTFNDLLEKATDIGDGYRKVEVTLEKGDTSYYPYSHKYVWAGPGTITYLIHATGWVDTPSKTIRRIYRR